MALRAVFHGSLSRAADSIRRRGTWPVCRCAVLFCCSGLCGSRSLPDRLSSRPSHRRSRPPPHLAWPIAVAPPFTPLLPTPQALNSSGAVGRRAASALVTHHEARHRCSRHSGSSSSRRRRRTLYGPAVLPTASTLWRPPLVLPSTLCTSAVQYPPVVWFHTLPPSAQRSPGRRTWRPTTRYLRRAISSRHL